MKSKKLKKLVLAGLFLALGFLMPFLTAQIQSLGNKLLPMHIPVLLCGFICGGFYGFIVGLILPVMRSAVFGMPPMIPIAIAMSFELAVYGLVSGLSYKYLPKKTIYIYISLIISMILGRIIWGIVSFFLYKLNNTEFSLSIFWSGAFINAIPGILIQLIIIPAIIISLRRTRQIDD